MDIPMIVLLVVAVLLLIAYPILISSKNKKEAQKVQEQTNSLKKGDKVLTTGGIYGTIVDVKFSDASKIIVIETGEGANKSTVSVDAYAIYTVFKDQKQMVAEKIEENKTSTEPKKKDKKKKQDEAVLEKMQQEEKKD